MFMPKLSPGNISLFSSGTGACCSIRFRGPAKEWIFGEGKVRSKADSGDVVGKRDYALLLFYVMTGMRRSEVIHLRGKDLEFEEDHLLVRCKIKGGDYVAREVGSPEVREASSSGLP